MICPFAKDTNVKYRGEDGHMYKKVVFLPCGKCYACRQSLVNSWVSRFLAECKSSEFQLFITLTYSDENLHYNDNSNPSLVKRHAQLFFKRLRKDFPEGRIRYYLCAEYGGTTWRPHYHVLLFCSGCDKDECKDSISKHWSHGHIHCGTVGPASIRYCANFHVHKSATPDGYTPTFTLMSRKPGIGALYFDGSIDQCLFIERRYFVHEGLKYPFGRYFHNRFTQQTGELSPTSGYDFWQAFSEVYEDEQSVEAGQQTARYKQYSANVRHRKL